MNSVKYLDNPQQNFPLSTAGLNFVQEQIKLVAELAKATGGNCVVSGCTGWGNPAANSVSDGVMVLDGEVIDFRGGPKQDYVRIRQETQSITANGSTYDGRTVRWAEFGTNVSGQGNYEAASIKPIYGNLLLRNMIQNEVAARMAAIEAETAARTAAIEVEAAARANGDNQVMSQFDIPWRDLPLYGNLINTDRNKSRFRFNAFGQLEVIIDCKLPAGVALSETVYIAQFVSMENINYYNTQPAYGSVRYTDYESHIVRGEIGMMLGVLYFRADGNIPAIGSDYSWTFANYVILQKFQIQ